MVLAGKRLTEKLTVAPGAALVGVKEAAGGLARVTVTTITSDATRPWLSVTVRVMSCTPGGTVTVALAPVAICWPARLQM